MKAKTHTLIKLQYIVLSAIIAALFLALLYNMLFNADWQTLASVSWV